MTQTLDPHTGEPGSTNRLRTKASRAGSAEADSVMDSFLSELRRMTPQERVEASRCTMNGHERAVYAARYPDEAPTVNGELEWIALRLA